MFILPPPSPFPHHVVQMLISTETVPGKESEKGGEIRGPVADPKKSKGLESVNRSPSTVVAFGIDSLGRLEQWRSSRTAPGQWPLTYSTTQNMSTVAKLGRSTERQNDVNKSV